MTVQYRPGAWSDVAPWVYDGLLNMVVDRAIVRCYLEDDIIWQQTAPEPLLFGRCAVQGGMLLTVHQGGKSGKVYLVNDRMVKELGPTFGTQPVGIDACSAYVVRSAAVYDRISLVSQSLPSGAPGSSQGLSDVQPDGTLWWADVHRTMTVNGTLFHYPNVRGPVTVGQVDNGIAAAVGGKTTLVIPSAGAYEPHVAVSPNGRVAICARTGQGAAYVATTIQELGG